MKKLIEQKVVAEEVVEVENEGLIALMGQNVLLFCLNYIYTGKLIGVNTSFIQLEDASVVYATGAFNSKDYLDAQKLHTKLWYVQVAAIESFGVGK